MNCKDCSAEAGDCVCHQEEPCAMCPKVTKALVAALKDVKVKYLKVLEVTGVL